MIKKPFSISASLAYARLALSKPSAEAHIERVEPKGEVVTEMVLPLELCEGQNRKDKKSRWSHMATKRALFRAMFAQHGGRHSEPLSGRPQVICIRFSSVQPDRFSDWAKAVIDRLCVHVPRVVKGKPSPNLKLGIIRDDAPKWCDVHQLWMSAPRGQGFVYLVVRTGAVT